MKKYIICLLCASLLVSACSKKNETVDRVLPPMITVAPAESLLGTLTGSTAPLGAIKNMLLVGNVNGKQYEVIPDALNGSFVFRDVPAGDYLMYFTAAEHFAVSPLPVKILARTTTGLGVITAKEKGYALSCMVNGEFQGWILKANWGTSSNLLQLTNYTAGGGIPEAHYTTVKYQLSISLGNFTGPGTYICNQTSGNSIRYNGYKSILVSSQDTQREGSAGVVMITSFDPVARLIKGTFSAELASRSSDSNDAKVLTDGLINVYY